MTDRFSELVPLASCAFCVEPPVPGSTRYDVVLGRAPGSVVQYVSSCGEHREALRELSAAFNTWSVNAWSLSISRASEELDERIRNAPWGEDDIPF